MPDKQTKPKKITDLNDQQLANLIENRWASSETVWDRVEKVYKQNLGAYKNEPEWLSLLPVKKAKVRANRIFVNMEAVINSVIANPPRPTILPGGETEDQKTYAQQQEKYFLRKYEERNIKEKLRKGLRNLYFGRLIVLKPFWSPALNDFDVKVVDPKKIRVHKNSTKEDDSEFAIEEVTDQLTNVLARFPEKKTQILAKSGIKTEEDILIKNPEIVYKEAWVRDMLVCKYDDIILSKGRNPYWDWDGILVTAEEEEQLKQTTGDGRRAVMQQIKLQQQSRLAAMQQKAQQPAATQQQPQGAPQQPAGAPQPGAQPSPLQPDPNGELPPLQGQDNPETYQAYYFNHFDHPRKPYIIATLFNNEDSPVGQTDMIEQAIPLQENIDARKRAITENADIVNGTIKVDSAVMDKEDAQKLRYEAGGVIWGSGVKDGVTRETGPALPAFVVQDLQDSRSEIDNIMAASSAFRGDREGVETKAGRLALIDQSYLRLNELVQVVDYVCSEMFNWFYQLAKTRYTEHHYAKVLGKDMAQEMLTIIQDDFMDGAEVRIIAGKMMPEDREFKYQQAQQDVQKGFIAPVDYLEIANYPNPKELAKNAFLSRVAPASLIGLTQDEMKNIPHPIPQSRIAETINFSDLPPAARAQWLSRMGINVTEQQIIAGEVAKSVLDGAAKGRGMDAPPNLEERATADEGPAGDQKAASLY